VIAEPGAGLARKAGQRLLLGSTKGMVGAALASSLLAGGWGWGKGGRRKRWHQPCPGGSSRKTLAFFTC